MDKKMFEEVARAIHHIAIFLLVIFVLLGAVFTYFLYASGVIFCLFAGAICFIIAVLAMPFFPDDEGPELWDNDY